MKREDCWMTFSEALEEYLEQRDILKEQRAGWRDAEERMKVCAQQMDALTGANHDQA